MSTRGLALAHEAAFGALDHIGPDGVTQSALARAMGVTKQAAQQFVDRLVMLDLAARLPDPADHRANRVRLTAQGQAVMTAANEVKVAIETSYRRTMGNSAFALLKATLNHLPRDRT